jgi:hypothetical protein
VQLQHALLHASLVATGVPASLAMGECASGTLVVLPPHCTVCKGTSVWLQLSPKPLSMQGSATVVGLLSHSCTQPRACFHAECLWGLTIRLLWR